MFLGCHKIDYHANHCNINPKAKEIQEDLTVVGKTSSCSCRTGIDYTKLRMEEEDMQLTSTELDGRDDTLPADVMHKSEILTLVEQLKFYFYVTILLDRQMLILTQQSIDTIMVGSLTLEAEIRATRSGPSRIFLLYVISFSINKSYIYIVGFGGLGTMCSL